MAAGVPQTLKYRGGQLNDAPVLEVKNFTNWKKRFLCHIIGIEPQFKNVIENGPFIPMTTDQKKPKGKWTGDERKAANLDQYKALMNELVNDGIKLSKLEINIGFINGLPKKWLSFCQSLRNTNHVKESELASLFGKLKYEENLIYNIYEIEKKKSLVSTTSLSTAFISTSIIQDFQDSSDDEEGTRSSQEYMDDLEEDYQARALLAKSKRPAKDFEAKYNKVKAILSLLSSSALASKSSMVKNKGLIAEAYEWDEEVSSDDNEMIEVKVLMALIDDENVAVGKKSTKNDEWVKIYIRKVHTLLEMEDNDDRKSFLDYLCIDLNYVEEQRNNLLSKHRDIVHELNTCKEQLIVLKLDFLTMQHVNTEILKENQNLRKELKELTAITETWLNCSNKVNQCITNDTKVSIPGVERPWLSKAEGFILPNHDTSRILPAESRVNTTDPPVTVTDSSSTDYDSADESSVCSTPLPLLENLVGAEPVFEPKTIKSILKSKSTFKAKNLNGITINEPSLALAKANNKASASKTNSTHVGKLKNVKIEDDIPLTIVIKELNDLKLQISKNQPSYFRNNKPQQVPENSLQNKYKTQFKKSCELFGLNNHLSENCYNVLFCKKCDRTDHKTCDHADYMSSINMSQHLKGQSRSSSRSKTPRPLKHFFPPCIHCGFSDHLYDDCVNYPICDIYGSYDHDTHGRIRVIPLRRGIKPRNPQHVIKSYKTCGSTVHTISDHNDIEWFRRGEALQAKNTEAHKSNKTESSNASRSKTPNKRWYSRYTWLYFLKKKCQAHETIMSFIKRVENQNDIKVKQLRTENGTDFRNSILVSFCDEKGISQNFSSPYTREQNGVAERKNRTLIEDARTMLSGSVFSKHRYINIAESERYPPDEYLHPYEPSQRFQTNRNDVSFIEPYERPESVVFKTNVSSDQNDQTDLNDHNDQNDHPDQTDEIFNDN
ncbi:retrovirus-related pol polyprotein from transposon TNT 1-94 [Tanacetum coccineum]